MSRSSAETSEDGQQNQPSRRTSFAPSAGDLHRYVQWLLARQHACYLISLVSVFLTFAASINACIVFSKSGYGLENIFVFLSSCVLLWRFKLPRIHASSLALELSSTQEDIPESAQSKFEKRDLRAEVAMLCIIFALGWFIIPMHVVNGWQWTEEARSEDLDHGLDGVSNFSLIFGFLLLTIDLWQRGLHLRISFEMKYPTTAMERSNDCVFIGFTMNLSLWADNYDFPSASKDINSGDVLFGPIASLLCSIFCLVYALYHLHHICVRRGVPIGSPQWWLEACYESWGDDCSQSIDRVEEEMRNNDANENEGLEIV